MARSLPRLCLGATAVGLVTGAGLVGAPPAVASTTYCMYARDITSQVIQLTTAMQTAASAKNWKWTDPPVQAAMDAITSGYPRLIAPVNQLVHPFTIGPWANGDPSGDAGVLAGAMNEQLDTLVNADTPSDVLPDAAATISAANALNTDCLGFV